MTALDNLLKKTVKTSASSNSSGSANNLNSLLSQVQSGKYQSPNSAYTTGTPPASLSSPPSAPVQPQQNAIGQFLTGVTQLAQKYIPQLNPSTAAPTVTPTTFQNPNQIQGPNKPLIPINPQEFQSPQQSVSAKPVVAASIPKPLNLSNQNENAKAVREMYAVNEQTQKATQSKSEALMASRDWLNKEIGNVKLFGAPPVVPPLEQVGNTNKNASPFFDEAQLKAQLNNWNNTPAAQLNHKTNIFIGDMTRGLTGGILKPEREASKSLADKVIGAIGETMGTVTALKGIGSVFDSFVEGSSTIGNFIDKYPKVAKYAIPFIKNAGTFDIYGQLDPDLKNRFQKLVTDTAVAIPFSINGGLPAISGVPVSVGLGYGLAKINGASNEDAIISGVILGVLDGTGRLGAKGNINQQVSDRIIRQESLKVMNEYSSSTLTEKSTPAEIRKAYIEAVKTEHPDVGGNAEKFKSVVASYEFLTGKNIHPDFVQGNASKEPVTTENKPVEAVQSEQKAIIQREVPTTEVTQKLNTTIENYVKDGGVFTSPDGKPQVTPSLMELTKMADDPEVVAHTQKQVEKIPKNEDGSITLYRGGTAADNKVLASAVYDKESRLVSAATTKEAAAKFVTPGSQDKIIEFKAKPTDIKVFIGGQEAEVLVPGDLVAQKTQPTNEKVTYKELKDFSFKSGAQDTQLETPADAKRFLTPKAEKIWLSLVKEENFPISKLKRGETFQDKGVAGRKVTEPIEIKPDGFILDGHHRLNQAIANGDKTIPVKIMPFRGEFEQKATEEILKSRRESANGEIVNQKIELLTQESPEKEVVSTENKQPKTAEIPHKEGFSRFQERMESQLLDMNGEKYHWDKTTQKYNKVDLKKDAQKALDLLQSDPDKAVRIAQGLEPVEKGSPLEFDVANAVALKAFDEGNTKLGTEVINRLSQKATRYGQEISSLRGNFNDNTPQHYMKELITRRMEKLGGTLVSTAEKNVKLSNKTKVTERIDRGVEKLSKQMKAERSKIRLAQDIIDSLTCK